MRRLALTAVALACLVSLAAAGTAGAASKVPGRPVLPHVTHRGVTNGEITVGSEWTYYDWDGFVGLTGICEVLTFGSGHAFSGDLGDAGHWSGNISLKFTGSSGIFPSGDGYKGKYYAPLFGSTADPNGFDGLLTSPNKNYPDGIGLIIAGDDPLAVGDC